LARWNMTSSAFFPSTFSTRKFTFPSGSGFPSLAALSILNMVYRLLMILLPDLRRLLLRCRVRNDYIIRSCDKLHVSYADWFLLSTLGENLSPVVFSEILNEIRNGMVKLNEPSALLNITESRDGNDAENTSLWESESNSTGIYCAPIKIHLMLIYL